MSLEDWILQLNICNNAFWKRVMPPFPSHFLSVATWVGYWYLVTALFHPTNIAMEYLHIFNRNIFNRKYIFRGTSFHCYVSLPECNFQETSKWGVEEQFLQQQTGWIWSNDGFWGDELTFDLSLFLAQQKHWKTLSGYLESHQGRSNHPQPGGSLVTTFLLRWISFAMSCLSLPLSWRNSYSIVPDW